MDACCITMVYNKTIALQLCLTLCGMLITYRLQAVWNIPRCTINQHAEIYTELHVRQYSIAK